jgi:hypothetical protein
MAIADIPSTLPSHADGAIDIVDVISTAKGLFKALAATALAAAVLYQL